MRSPSRALQLLAFTLFFFIVQVASAQSGESPGICSGQPLQTQILVNQIPLLGVALIALSISIDVVAIGYIIGKLVPGTQLSQWVKKEYWEIAKSAILIAGIFAILAFLGGFAASLNYGISPYTIPTAAGSSVQNTGPLSTAFTALTVAAQTYLIQVYCPTTATSPPLTMQWYWGDGNYQTSYGGFSGVQHTYASAGTYTVKVTASDNTGNEAIGSQSLAVGVQGPSGQFTSTTSGSGQPIQMNIDFQVSGTTLMPSGSINDPNIPSPTAQNFVSSDYGNTFGGYFSGLGLGLGMLRSLSVSYYIPIPIGLLVPGAGQAIPTFFLGTIFNPYANKMVLQDIDANTYEGLMNDAISVLVLPVYSIIDFEYYLLPLLTFVGLAFLIPMGIIFRAMPFVRGIGGTLVAIGIGIALVLPAALVLINQPIYNFVQAQLGTQYNGQGNCNGLAWWFSALPGGAGCTSGIGANSGNGWLDAFTSFQEIYPAMNGIFFYSITSVLQLLLFILDLMILFPMIEAVAKSLGGTINIQFGKLRVK